VITFCNRLDLRSSERATRVAGTERAPAAVVPIVGGASGAAASRPLVVDAAMSVLGQTPRIGFAFPIDRRPSVALRSYSTTRFPYDP
jgi:hypothetical protein